MLPMGYESRFSKESHTQSNETMGFEDMPLKFLQLIFLPFEDPWWIFTTTSKRCLVTRIHVEKHMRREIYH